MACSFGTINCNSGTFLKQFSTGCLATCPAFHHPGCPLHDVLVEVRRDLCCGQLLHASREDNLLVRSDDVLVGVR
eukprot:15681879-Heterocapsa_arctica.AAC.1